MAHSLLNENPRHVGILGFLSRLWQRDRDDSSSSEEEVDDAEDLRQSTRKAREQQEARERAESAREKKAKERERKAIAKRMKERNSRGGDVSLVSGDNFVPTGSPDSRRESVDQFKANPAFTTLGRTKRRDSW